MEDLGGFDMYTSTVRITRKIYIRVLSVVKIVSAGRAQHIARCCLQNLACTLSEKHRHNVRLTFIVLATVGSANV